MAKYPIQVESDSVGGNPTGISSGKRRANTLVTRGFGRNQSVVVQGFGIMAFLKEVLTRFITLGKSSAKKALNEIHEVMVFAKLIRINEELPKNQIQGQLVVKLTETVTHAKVVDKVKVKARSMWEDVKITVKRLK